jgi:hypothetical protein
LGIDGRMTLLGEETVTVRPQTQAFAAGVGSLTPGATFKLQATILPIAFKELQRLPEASRTSAKFSMIVEGDQALRVKAPGARIDCSAGECVVIGEVDYTIHKTGLPHRSFILALRSGDE